MEKCNDNFFVISDKGGGPAGVEGEKGSQGVPTKPKVPIHIWVEGDYDEKVKIEEDSGDIKYILEPINEDLTNQKYQEGHLILLKNAHVYILKLSDIDNKLVPIYAFTLEIQSNFKGKDGKNAYVYFKYANEEDLNNNETINNYDYIGICSTDSETAPESYSNYSWHKIKDKNINIEYIDKNTLQGSEFTKKMFSKQVTSSSDFIVDSSNTNQENYENKVIVGGNNIKIVSKDGFTSALISSDDIMFDEYTAEKTYEYTEKNTNNYWETLYTNVNIEDNPIIESSYNEIGFIYEISSFEIITSIKNLNYNDWSFNNKGIYLIIEVYNSNSNNWEKIEELKLDISDNNWKIYNEDQSKIYYDVNLENINLKKCYCRFKIKINKNGINISKSDFNKNDFNILLASKLNYVLYNPTDEKNSESCVILGKNGIFVRTHDIDSNGDGSKSYNTFHISNKEILMYVGGGTNIGGKETGSGLRIVNDGIYVKKNGGDWQALNT